MERMWTLVMYMASSLQSTSDLHGLRGVGPLGTWAGSQGSRYHSTVGLPSPGVHSS